MLDNGRTARAPRGSDGVGADDDPPSAGDVAMRERPVMLTMNVMRADRTATYERWLTTLTLTNIRERMADAGAERLLVKRLSDKQDNTKNQIYFGKVDVTKIPLPMGQFVASRTESKKDSSGQQLKFHAPVDLAWLTPAGHNPAPNAQLIFYPQYPEVRFSGFLKGAVDAPRNQLNRETQLPGRWLILGVAGDSVLGVVVPAVSPAAAELELQPVGDGQLLRALELDSHHATTGLISVDELLAELHAVHLKSPIPGCRILADGTVVPFTGRPAGGTTLETVLGVRANANVGPDFHGWELKSFAGARVTLMTPAPTGGAIREDGFESFIQRFGYFNPDKGRWEFTGQHRVGKDPGGKATTSLVMHGYDGGVRDPNGGIALVDRAGRVGATWTFTDLLDHWRKKHASAAYVQNTRIGDTFIYAAKVKIATGADFTTFLERLADGTIIFDPGCHWRPPGGALRPERKLRYQFRVTSATVDRMYDRAEIRDARKVAADDTISTRDLRRLGVTLPIPSIGHRPLEP